MRVIGSRVVRVLEKALPSFPPCRLERRTGERGNDFDVIAQYQVEYHAI